MQRDRLFDILCGMIAAKGRDKTLLGDGIDIARHAFCRMAPESSFVHAYFEIPLLGTPTFDVLCSVEHGQVATIAGDGTDGPWQAALAWLRDAGPFATNARRVLLVAEADTSTGQAMQSGMYLIQRERADLVAPFFHVVGEPDRIDAWERFARRLPKGWETTYTGLFPSRPNTPLRVNAHPSPTTADASGIEESCETLGIDFSGNAKGLFLELASIARGYDIQFDLNNEGVPFDVFGLEFFLYDRVGEPHTDQGLGSRVMAPLEHAGIADKRWQRAADACRSRIVALPGNGQELESIAVNVRPFSVKYKVIGGRPLPAKLYLSADARVLVRR